MNEMNTIRKTKASSIDQLEMGEVCLVDFGKNYKVETKFIGWAIEHCQPYAYFVDVKDGLEWYAYIFENKICFGSSALPLKISRYV